MNDSNHNPEHQEHSLRELIEQYTRYWYLFVLGVILALTGAYLYLRYTTSYYESKATVIIKDEKSGGGPAELAAFSELGSWFSKYSNNKIENELAIFNSKRIISEVVKALNLNIKYESIGTFKTSEIYDYKPFEIQFLSFNDSVKSRPAPKLFLEVLSNTDFKIENESQTIQGSYSFGNRIELPFGDIIVFPDMNNALRFDDYIGKVVSVKYSSVESVALRYQGRVKVLNEITRSNVVVLRMQSPVASKAEDFIDELIFQYNKDAINDRNQVAQKTSNFIDSRLEIITRELDSVERNKEQFKSQNRLTDIRAESQLILENANEFNMRQLDVGARLELTNTMIDYIENASGGDLLPANIGLDGEDISQAVNNYNNLVLQRDKLLKSSTLKNPVVINVDNQISQIRSSILSSLENSRSSLEIAYRDLNNQQSVFSSRISQAPSMEKIFRGIERQQTIKEQLYLFLLKQREEASISLAVTAPKAKIVDNAYSGSSPILPNVSITYGAALLAGLLVPFLLLYSRSLLNIKVANRRDVERVLNGTPLLGEIPKLSKGDKDFIQHNDRSILAESFRILRTNLHYLFVNKLNGQAEAKSIFVTSTIKGEGKTFVAFNLSLALAVTGKKVVLVGGDIRNPQLHRYLPGGEKGKKGLTEYIMDEGLDIKEIVSKSAHNDNLDIILSGEIPPNPAELLMQNRTNTFFKELKQEYDYLIVDTAPSMLVTDTLLINKMADVTLYVVRAGFTDKRLLEFIKDAISDQRICNVATVLNNVNLNNFGYGNKYGYTYSRQKGSFIKRFF